MISTPESFGVLTSIFHSLVSEKEARGEVRTEPIYLFVQQIFFEHPLCARQCARHWASKMIKVNPIHFVMGNIDTRQGWDEREKGLKNSEGLWEALKETALKWSPEQYLGVIQGRAAALPGCTTPECAFHTILWKCVRKTRRTRARKWWGWGRQGAGVGGKGGGRAGEQAVGGTPELIGV